jgi:2-keto-4-pentenoate hydratase
MGFDIDRAASLLVQGRRENRLMRVFNPGPRGQRDAYSVQTEVARRLGSIGGWKVGAKTPDEIPNAAPLMADLMKVSPAEWSSHALNTRCVEAEIAFRIGRNIPQRAKPLSEEEVLAAVSSVHAAIEIVDTRLVDWAHADPLWKLADHQSNGGFVFDPTGVAWRQQDLTNTPVRLIVDGEVKVDTNGGNPAGNPSWLLVWLVNHCVLERGGIEAGAVITTGSFTGMEFVEPGAAVEAEFPGIGRASVQFIG